MPEPSPGPSACFDHAIAFDPGADFEAFVRAVPARGAVYLLADADERPVQLLCVANLRNSVKRRLGPPGADDPAAALTPSRRVNYRELARRVYWTRVDGAFEADCVYYEAARQVFPGTYCGMLGMRPAWFVHVDPGANFPRYTKTTDLTVRSGTLLGPVEDKHAAARLIQLVEDAFDLCRYYNLLIEAPHAKPCAYKEMGKCPAPCDGSISMEQYRALLELSVRAIIDPAETRRQHTRRMQQAAEELQFESAAKIKSYVDQLAQLGAGPFRHVRPMTDFQYLSLQRGPRPDTAKVFLITAGRIECVACLPCEPARPSDVRRLVYERAAAAANAVVDEVGSERVGLVAHHLFAAKRASGVFLPLDKVDDRSLIKAFRDVQKQKPARRTPAPAGSATDDNPDAGEDEGLMKELQAM